MYVWKLRSAFKITHVFGMLTTDRGVKNRKSGAAKPWNLLKESVLSSFRCRRFLSSQYLISAMQQMRPLTGLRQLAGTDIYIYNYVSSAYE